MNIQTITTSQVRAEQVARWGEAKVVANELDVLRRFGKNSPELVARYGLGVFPLAVA